MLVYQIVIPHKVIFLQVSLEEANHLTTFGDKKKQTPGRPIKTHLQTLNVINNPMKTSWNPIRSYQTPLNPIKNHYESQ